MNRRIALILTLLPTFWLWPTWRATAESIDEEKAAKVRSAYVLNFLRFSDWPENSFRDEDSPLKIAVLGREVLRPFLERTVHGKRYSGRPIEVRRYSLPRRDRYDRKERYSRAVRELRERLRRCHLVYFPERTLQRAGGYLTALRSEPILVIGESRAFAERGAMLALAIRRGRIVFFANVEAIGASPLGVSSKLLRLARVIEPDR